MVIVFWRSLWLHMPVRTRLPRSRGPLTLAQTVTWQLKLARLARRVTQEALAEILDIPVQHVSRIEGGQNIALDTLERVAIALGLQARFNFVDNPEGPLRPPPSRRQQTIARKARAAKS